MYTYVNMMVNMLVTKQDNKSGMGYLLRFKTFHRKCCGFHFFLFNLNRSMEAECIVASVAAAVVVVGLLV